MQKPKFLLQPKTSNLKPSQGYTLIELLVAMSVFVIVTSIAIGGYVRGIKTNRQAASLASANSNIASAIEQMMREMRVGFAFSSCPGGCIEFRNLPTSNPASKLITYKIDGERILRGENNSNFTPITDDNVKIGYSKFTLMHTPNYPDRIIIQIGVNAEELGVEGGQINLQTTVSARN